MKSLCGTYNSPIATNSPRTITPRYHNVSGIAFVLSDSPKSSINHPNVWAWHTTSITRFERKISSGQTTDYTYIESPNGLVAAIKTTGSQHDAMLLATDHLGSIVGMWNASGTLLEEHRSSALNLRPLTAKAKRRARPWGHGWARC